MRRQNYRIETEAHSPVREGFAWLMPDGSLHEESWGLEMAPQVWEGIDRRTFDGCRRALSKSEEFDQGAKIVLVRVYAPASEKDRQWVYRIQAEHPFEGL